MGRAKRGQWYVKKWTKIYLKGALDRFRQLTSGMDWTIEDVYAMQFVSLTEFSSNLFFF